jgi:chromosome partitioning protein
LDIDIDQWSAVDWNLSRSEEKQFSTAKTYARDIAELLRRGRKNGAGMAVIDTAPRSRKEARVAAELSDLILIPCPPERFDLRAVANSVEIARLVNVPFAVVISKAPRGKKLLSDTRELFADAKIPVLDAVVLHRAVYKHAVLDGLSVYEYEPEGEAAAEIDTLFAEVQSMLGGDHAHQ